nr:NADH dehydrogenase subunit 3 [Orthomeria smaragdinum]
MLMTLISSLIMMIMANMMMLLNMLLMKKMMNDREKSSPFECGFDMKSSSRNPFSLKFFMIAVIFLIFDVEIALMLPMLPTLMYINMKQWLITSMLFTTILMMGLYHEWYQGVLNWTK